jgi:hypothetical protein
MKVLCKKDFFTTQDIQIFWKDRYYEVKIIDSVSYYIVCEYKFRVEFPFNIIRFFKKDFKEYKFFTGYNYYFEDFFCTPQEMRKIKLEKLYENFM